MFRCPCCNKMIIGRLDKFLLGPSKSLKCTKCESNISISYSSLFSIVFYFIMIHLIVRQHFNMILQISLLISSCIVFCYFHYRLTPLIVKLSKEDEGFKKEQRKRIMIVAVFSMMMVLIILLFVFPLQIEVRDYVVNDTTEIHKNIVAIENSIESEEFEAVLKEARINIIDIQYRFYKSYSLANYIDLQFIDGLNLVVQRYDEMED